MRAGGIKFEGDSGKTQTKLEKEIRECKMDGDDCKKAPTIPFSSQFGFGSAFLSDVLIVNAIDVVFVALFAPISFYHLRPN